MVNRVVLIVAGRPWDDWMRVETVPRVGELIIRKDRTWMIKQVIWNWDLPEKTAFIHLEQWP